MSATPQEPLSKRWNLSWSIAFALCLLTLGGIIPVLAGAMRPSGNRVCLSQLQRIGKATLLYTQDYDQTYPMAWSVDGGAYWPKSVYAYVAGSPVSEAEIEKLFHCPEDLQKPNPISYAANAMIAGAKPRADFILSAKRNADAITPEKVIWVGDSNKNWKRQVGFHETPTDWIRPLNDLASGEQEDATFAFYRRWLKHRDWTGIQADPWDCPDGLYLCKYPSFHHGRRGERTGKANFLFMDGHAKSFAWGTLNVENFFPAPSQRQLNLFNN